MKRILLILALLSSPAWATWTVKQAAIVKTTNCTATNQTCTLPVSGIVQHDVIVVAIGIADASEVITAVTDDGSGGSSTYTHSGSGCHGSDAGSGKGTDCWWSLDAKASITTITITRTDATNHVWRTMGISAAFTSSPASLDTGTPQVRDQSSNTTSPAGVTATLAGTNDLWCQIIWATTPTAITGTPSGGTAYTTNSAFSGSGGIACSINTVDGATAGSWTTGNAAAALSAVAFTEAASSSGHCASCDISKLQFPLSRRRPLIE